MSDWNEEEPITLAEIKKAHKQSGGYDMLSQHADWLIAEVESLREGDEDVDKANKDLADEVERLGGALDRKIAGDAVEQAVCNAMQNGWEAGMEAAAKECEGQFGTFWADLIRTAAKEKARDGSTQTAQN